MYAHVMKFTRRKLIWLGLALAVGGMLFVLTAKNNYLPFAPNMRKGDLFLISAEALHPTQQMVGFREVKKKSEVFNKMSEEKLSAKMQETNTSMIIGPGGIPYLADGHHRALSLIHI